MDRAADSNPDRTPATDVEIAKLAIQRGDLTHAAFQLSCALRIDPQNIQWLVSIDGTIETAPQPLELLPLERDIDRLDEALAIAQANYDLDPNWHTAIGRALVYRALGEIDAAVAAYLQASELDLTDVCALLDIADLLCERGEIATGVNYYLRAIERQPHHPWARPHYFYYQFFLHQDVFWQERLQEYSAKHPDNPHAARLANEIRPL